MVQWFEQCPADDAWVKQYGYYEPTASIIYLNYSKNLILANFNVVYRPFEKGLEQGQLYMHTYTQIHACTHAAHSNRETYTQYVYAAFYRTLVDTRDRERPFMTIAAEENLIPLHDETVT